MARISERTQPGVVVAKNKILEATQGIVPLLEPLDSEERVRAVQAAMTLLGEGAVPLPNAADASAGRQAGSNTDGGKVAAKEYFDTKQPKTKMHQLAVAARYREEHLGAVASTQQELRSVFSDARRNFDANKYTRDINNARDRGIFTKGTGKDSAVLSHRGQEFVDALPDYVAARKILKGHRKKKKKSKRKTAKKATKK
jgi:hypothetical protein